MKEPFLDITITKDDIKPQIAQAIKDLVKAHEAGKVRGIFYVADVGDENRAAVCIIEDSRFHCQTIARNLLNEHGKWEPPPDESAPHEIQVEYFLSRLASEFIKGHIGALTVITVPPGGQDSGVVCFGNDEAARDTMVKELHGAVLRIHKGPSQ